jgi:DNA polymerase-4
MPISTWPRAIALVDMNAFFASVEQLDFPQLREQPVAVTNGERGTCIITSSYEARAQGIKTGMRLREARKLCPEIVQRPARPRRYAQVSTKIMGALACITPDIEIFSVDEAFLDLTHILPLQQRDPAWLAQMIQRQVWNASSLPCSVGLSGDKTTAKVAAKQKKPKGITVVAPWQAATFLAPLPVTDLCGINRGIGGWLAQRGIATCGQMRQLPISELARRFGNPGRRIWYMAQGSDPEPVITTVADPKSVGHGKVMPPGTIDRRVVLTYLNHMTVKVAARLRHYELEASLFFFGLRTDYGWMGTKIRTTPTNDSHVIYKSCTDFLREEWRGEGVSQIQVTALNPAQMQIQPDLFAMEDIRKQLLNRTVDAINSKFGALSIAPGMLVQRSDMPDVIAPAWKPIGIRQTIE